MLATLIVPQATLATNASIHENVRDWLCDQFGGFTAHDATGGWKAPGGAVIVEPVTCYDVACEDTAEIRERLRTMARRVKADLGQECVYLAFNPSVQVEFI
jgi:hypothetical protein